MKSTSLVLVIAAAACTLATIARGELQLTGIVGVSPKVKFCIEDTARPNSALWLSIGSSFGDYLLKQYDPETGRLTLVSEDQTIVLKLREAKIQAVQVAPPTASSVPPENANQSALTDEQLLAAGQHRLRAGDTLARIAHQNGVSIRDLQSWNPGIRPDRLQIGQIVVVRAPPVANPAVR